jgi:hypothetical protein
LQDASGGQYAGFDAPATVSSSYVLTMPTAVGGSGQALRASDGAGALEWYTPGDVGDITNVIAGTGLSGGGSTGAVTLNVDAAQTQITSVGTLTSLVATTADINAGTFDGIVGGTTPADGSFTTLSASSTLSVTGASTLSGGATVVGGILHAQSQMGLGLTNSLNSSVNRLQFYGAGSTARGQIQHSRSALGDIVILSSDSAGITLAPSSGTVLLDGDLTVADIAASGTLSVTGTSTMAAINATGNITVAGGAPLLIVEDTTSYSAGATTSQIFMQGFGSSGVKLNLVGFTAQATAGRYSNLVIETANGSGGAQTAMTLTGAATPAATFPGSLTVSAGETSLTNAVSTAYVGTLSMYDSTAIAAGVGGQLVFGGKYTGSTYTQWAGIQGTKTNATDGQYGGGLEFRTRVHGGALTTKMTVADDGLVGIGTATPTSMCGATGYLEIAGSVVGLRLTDTSMTPSDWEFCVNNGPMGIYAESTGASSMNFDQDGTVTVPNGPLAVTEDVIIGTNPSSAGDIRLNKDFGIFTRNNANDANKVIISENVVTGNDTLDFGDNGKWTALRFHCSTANVMELTSSAINLNKPVTAAGQTIINGGAGNFKVNTTASNSTAEFVNTNAAPYGQYIHFSVAQPSNTTSFFIKMQDYAAVKAVIYSDGSYQGAANSYGAISDRSLKQNIVSMESNWDNYRQLDWSNFQYIDNPEKDMRGLVAQDVQELFPGCVYEDGGTDKLALNYMGIATETGRAVVECQTRIEALEAQLTG